MKRVRLYNVVYTGTGGYVTSVRAASAAAALRKARAMTGGRERMSAHLDDPDRRNPGRKLTKTQKKARTKKLSAKRRVANALKAYLQKSNPGRKLAGAKVQKNKGSITIVPVFLKKRK